jgi:hypothetical protein
MCKFMPASTVALVDPPNVSQVLSSIDRNTQDINKGIFKTDTYIGAGIAQSV